MFGGTFEPAQSSQMQLARIAGDRHCVCALITGVTDMTRGVLRGGVFMDRSRERCEQQGEKADECDKASRTRSSGKPVLHVSSDYTRNVPASNHQQWQHEP